MKKRLHTCSRKITVGNEQGLHARPVTQFAQLANQYECKIQVTKGDLTVDGKSVMSMLRLGAARGTVLNIVGEGADAAEAVTKLSELIASLAEKEKQRRAKEN